MLHIVRHSPFAGEGFDLLFEVLQSGDAVALIEDAVYALKSPEVMACLRGFEGVGIQALREDVEARGLLDPGYEDLCINYAALVDLICENPQIHSWP